MHIPHHMKTISVRELRGRFPEIRKKMEGGESFILIHRSKPIGELRPLHTIRKNVNVAQLEGIWKKSSLRRKGSVHAQHALTTYWT